MTKYLCMQRSEPKQTQMKGKPSPTEMEEMYAKFNAWQEKFNQNIIDMGGKLGAGKLVTNEGITDGSMVETKELIGGFMIIAADSIEDAMEIAKNCPGLVSPGSSVWVREINTPQA